MGTVRYRSRDTGVVVTYASTIPRLEADDRYVRVDDEDDPDAGPQPDDSEDDGDGDGGDA